LILTRDRVCFLPLESKRKESPHADVKKQGSMNVILDELWVEMLVPWNKLEEMAPWKELYDGYKEVCEEM
jgi:hypothetical protein